MKAGHYGSLNVEQYGSFRIPWTANRSNQSILMEIHLDFPSVGQILDSKLKYFFYIMGRHGQLEEDVMLRKLNFKEEDDDRRRCVTAAFK